MNKHYSGAVWYPYAQMKEYEEAPPIFIEKAKGIFLYDDQGNRYYDTISSWWCNLLGHGREELGQALSLQHQTLDHIIFSGFTHQPAEKLATELLKVLPTHLRKIFYSDNGSTAIEVALKMSINYWQLKNKPAKKKFIHLKKSYHGDTFGAMSVAGTDNFFKRFSALFFPTYGIEAPYCYRCPMQCKKESCQCECLDELEVLVGEHSDEIAAIIMEPMIMAAGGMIIYPGKYLDRMESIIRKHDIHIIYDEVAVGFCRTGKYFAHQYSRTKPDFMCLSKAITGGTLPLAVTAMTQEIYNTFLGDSDRTFYHGHTYTANPLACAVALEVLKILESNHYQEKAEKELIPAFEDELSKFKEIEHVGETRSLGLIGAVELVMDTKTKTPFPTEWKIFKRIYREGIKKGLMLRPIGNCIYYYLPLAIEAEEIRKVCSMTREILKLLPKMIEEAKAVSPKT